MPKSPVRVAGHALHPMLINLPLGLWISSFAWDVIYLATGRPMWAEVAFWTIVGGCIGAGLAAIPGLIDYLRIVPGHTRARRVGLQHALLNVLVLALFIVDAVARDRYGYEHPPVAPMVLGWVALGIAAIAAWLGGELVERLGIAVHIDAHPDAPSSLERPQVHSVRTPERPQPRGPSPEAA